MSRPNNFIYEFFIRLFDIFISGLGIITLTPFFILLSILIKIDSEGPVFFFRKVKGLNGNEFIFYKFRTMVINAHEQLLNDHELASSYEKYNKVPNDPRITRIGNLLRKHSIDEIPQLWNVLKGDMTLVGPRVLGNIELKWYGDYGKKILSIKPGLTGLAQVKNKPGEIHRRIACDLHFIRNRNICYYFFIIYLTIITAIVGNNR